MKNLLLTLSFLLAVCYSSTLVAVGGKNNDDHSTPEIFDYIIVGAGQAGSVLANRLSEDPTNSVLVLEVGRDDVRLPEKLPIASSAPVPQPGDYHWGVYQRAGPAARGAHQSRGFMEAFYHTKQTSDPKSRSYSYPRAMTLGGCTTHNQQVAIRNGKYNWDKWVDLGLTQWNHDEMVKYYKRSENRSQKNAFGALYFNPNLPNGTLGSFDSNYFGLNGMVPLMHPPIVGPNLNFLNIVNSAVNSALGQFNYGINIDIDHPIAGARGGTGLATVTSTDQNGRLISPGTDNEISFVDYNMPIYGDTGFVWPPEFARLNMPQFVGRSPTQRVTAENTYLHAASSTRSNLQVRTESFVTKILTSTIGRKVRATGVEYLEDAWNVFQTGRNSNVERAGFGGTSADAKYNAYFAQLKPKKRVYARKQVILAGGAINTPHLMMLSGIGNPTDLAQLNIPSVVNLPGVGQNLVDNQEIFGFWQTNKTVASPSIPVLLAAKSTVSQSNPNFDILVGAVPPQAIESTDPFIQKGWAGVKNMGAVDNNYVRNNFENLLQDVNAVGNPATIFKPIYSDPSHRTGFIVEKEEDNYSKGYVRLVSADPTVPPEVIGNYLQDTAGAGGSSQDLQDFVDAFMTNLFPLMLALRPSGYFDQLLDPAPSDFLNNGVVYFTDMSQVNVTRLTEWIYAHVGAHHAMGTAKMGLPTDPMAVVDYRGKVLKMDGLFVADASIIPISFRWPNANLYPVAEKIADYVKAENSGASSHEEDNNNYSNY
jgi:choline dehydrogenase